MTEQPTRRTVDTITDPELSALYDRAEQAEAVLARVRRLATNWIILRTHGGAAYELRSALDPQEPR